MDETKEQLEDFGTRIATLETSSLGPNPNVNPLTIQNIKNIVSTQLGGAVTSVTASGSGITSSPTTGAVVVRNTGVTSNVAGTGITVSGATGAVMITNGGVTSLVQGSGITLSGSTGAVTVSTSGSGAVLEADGTDTESMTSGVQVTHTITHGLGTTPKIIRAMTSFTPISPAGSSANNGRATGDIVLNGSGTVIGGSYYSFLTGTPAGSFTFVGTGAGAGSISGQSTTNAGTGTSSVAVNNVTSTTFDIVYNSTNATVGNPQVFTVYWYVFA